MRLTRDFKKAWYGKGLVLFSHEHYEKALEAFEQAVLENQYEGTKIDESEISDPELEDAWTKIGLAQLKTERYEDAFETFEKVVEKKPTDADVWYLSGLVLRGLDQDEEAVEVLRRLWNSTPPLQLPLSRKGLPFLHCAGTKKPGKTLVQPLSGTLKTQISFTAVQ